MSWIILFLAGLFEVCWAVGLKYTDGFTRPLPTLLTIAAMILQQAMGLGVIGFVVGKVAATIWAPVLPKFVLLLTQDAVIGFGATMLICALASTLAIRVALRVDPAQAIS